MWRNKQTPFQACHGLLDLAHRTAGAHAVKKAKCTSWSIFMQDWWRLSCLLHTSAEINSISQSLPATTSQVSCLWLFLNPVTWRQLQAQCLSSDAGECWPAAPGGGPQGSLPPHVFALYFKEGGVGTFLPLYFRFIDIARDNLHQVQQQPAAPQELVATA